MLSFTLLVLTATEPSPVTLASSPFNTLNVSAEVGSFCNEHLAQQFTERGIQVATVRQIAALLGVERQKQLSGCAGDGGSCTAELAAALGADGLLLGDVGKLGDQLQVNVKVLRSSTGKVVASWSRTVTSEGALFGALSDAAEELTPRALLAFGRAMETRHQFPLVPAVLAGALGVGAGVCFGVAVANNARLTNTTATPGSLSASEANGLQHGGEALQWAARIAGGAAVVAAATGVVLWFTSAERVPVTVGLGVTPGAAAVSVSGRF